MPLGSRVAFVIVLTVILFVACAGPSHNDSADATKRGTQILQSGRLPNCRQAEISTKAWPEVTSSDGTLKLRLPDSHSRRLPSGSPDNWDIWVFREGTFSYRYAPVEERLNDSIQTDPNSMSHGWCLDELDGVRSLVQYVYAAHAATGAGYYLQAYRPVDAHQELILLGHARDTLHAPVLLAIARSVRLHAGPSRR